MGDVNVRSKAVATTLAPHNPMGPLDTAVNLHFCASAPNFKILEHILPTESNWGRQLAAAHLQEAGCRGILCLPPHGLPGKHCALKVRAKRSAQPCGAYLT